MGCFFSPAGTGDRGTGIRKARATCAYRITSRCKGSQHKWSVYTVIFLAGRCWTTFFFPCLLLIPLEVGNPLGWHHSHPHDCSWFSRYSARVSEATPRRAPLTSTQATYLPFSSPAYTPLLILGPGLSPASASYPSIFSHAFVSAPDPTTVSASAQRSRLATGWTKSCRHSEKIRPLSRTCINTAGRMSN